jgi:hypothetical protein
VTTASSQLSFSSQQEQEDVFASNVDTTSSSSSSSSFSTTTTTKKSVCFDESRNEAFDNTQICREECEEFWYTAQDFGQFKESTYLYADTVRASEKHCGGGPCSYERVIKRVYLACCGQEEQATQDSSDTASCDELLLPLSLSRNLNRWMSSSSAVNRLGMERLIVRQIRKDRSERRKQVVRAVLEIQALEHMNQVVYNYTHVSEQMRLASQSLSRPSRLFSMCMAQAQQASSSAMEQADNM